MNATAQLVLSYAMIIGSYIGVPLLLWAAFRWSYRWFAGGGRPIESFLPHPAPRPSRTARWAESLLLGALGGMALLATSEAVQLLQNGWEPTDQQRDRVLLILAAHAAAVGVAMLLCWWRTVAAIMWLVAWHVTLLFGGEVGLFAATRDIKAEGDIDQCPVIIDLGDQTDHVDILANGVYLGQSPIHTTIGALQALPAWESAPLDRNEDGYEPSTWSQHPLHVSPRPGSGESDKLRVFFRTELDGTDVGRNRGSSGGGGTFQGRSWYPATLSLDVQFKKREAVFRRIIDHARLRYYEVGPDWETTVASYGPALRNMLLDLAEHEPQLLGLLDRMAAREYALDDVKSAAEAWQKFQTIAAQANEQSSYATDSPAGRAVEQLAKLVDAHTVADAAVTRLRSLGWAQVGDHWNRSRFGVPQFGTRPGWKPKRLQLQPSDFALAHLVHRLDRRLDAEMPYDDNVLEDRLIPELARYHTYYEISDFWSSYLGGNLAARLSNSGIYASDAPRHVPFVQNYEASERLQQLSKLDDPVAKRWRAEHSRDLLQHAEEICRQLRRHGGSSELEFVFLDDPHLPNSLAVQVWPFFRDAIRRGANAGDSHEPTAEQWRYLLRIEPNTTAQMYVDAWLVGRKEPHFDHGWHELIPKIPSDKRQQVLEQLVAKTSERMDQLKGQRQTNMKHELERLQRDLAKANRPQRAGEEIIDRISGHPSDVGTQIAIMTDAFKADRDQPYVQSLAESSDEREQRWAVAAVRLFPTQKNRERLNLLIKHVHENVRDSATQLAKELDEIAAKVPEPRQRKVRKASD